VTEPVLDAGTGTGTGTGDDRYLSYLSGRTLR
jgi:hypothetical protein